MGKWILGLIDVALAVFVVLVLFVVFVVFDYNFLTPDINEKPY